MQKGETMDMWNNIEPGKKIPDQVHVVVEIPKGSQNKYEYDKKMNVFKLDRVLFSPFHYPGDYGFIPRTLALDGDPLDALVLVSHPTFPGVIIEAKPIGILKMRDNGKEDEKILCVPLYDHRFSDFNDIGDVKKTVAQEIAHFFKVYKELENKTVEIIGWEDASTAKAMIKECIDRYKEH